MFSNQKQKGSIMLPEQPPTPKVTTLDGGTNFEGVGQDDLVLTGAGPRKILSPAGSVLTSDRLPISEAPDGAHLRLDGGQTIKLGGEVLAVVQANPNPNPNQG